MTTITTGRRWVHEELPEGIPGRPGYQLGCRCTECKEANKVYMREYRARIQHSKQREDGSAEYHTHKGMPSKYSARRYGCSHSQCLGKAGLKLTEEGVVVNAATGEVDATFGEVRS